MRNNSNLIEELTICRETIAVIAANINESESCEEAIGRIEDVLDEYFK